MKRAVVTGATGQDARLLIPELLRRGYEVHAITRDARSADQLYGDAVVAHEADLVAGAERWAETVADLLPEVVFNLTGLTSVSESFADPAMSWRLNAEWPAALLEAIRVRAPETRLYQASSSEMFGCLPGESVVHDEDSPFRPQSPYAASKAAAHLLCGVYRRSFGIRVACGILFNHESRYRGPAFLTTKVARHVAGLRALDARSARSHPPLRVGRLDVERDWGWAEEYVDGILLVADQIQVRSRRSGQAIEDSGSHYHDYVLGTGSVMSVRDLIDRALTLGGFPLTWSVDEEGRGSARFADGNGIAVESVPEFWRAAEPRAIQADPSRAERELGWRARSSVDVFLREMIGSGEGR